ncbi:MFS transporter [Nocardioides campestrisoli]|uniref:MFS transporter n=1 Tax=Nocardioides campestrisoli TaxID=2736757 RepID=UPI0015E77F1B|nr:MFS transporter [Nocardioides campestrisoli]
MSGGGTSLTGEQVYRRFLALTALRWLPTGLLMPVMVLLALERGLSLSQLGLAAAVQGLVVVALELPTGGLADSLGRRRLLLVGKTINLAALLVLLVADSVTGFVVFFALQGLYRALDSGPLEAWYVDTARALDPRTSLARGMGAQGAVLAVAIAVGSAGAGLLVAWDPVPGADALVVPVVLAAVLQAGALLATALLMVEAPRSAGLGFRRQLAATPGTVRAGFALVRGDRVLFALLAVELFWGFGMATFESLTPVRLAEVVGDERQAAAILGPALTGVWIASALGSALTPRLCDRWGVAPTAALMRVLQGLAVLGMGVAAGVVGLLTAFLACYAVHGLSNAAHVSLLHEQATDDVRATVLSLNSMVAQPAGAVGMVALTALADSTSVSLAMCVGAVVLALAAPLYLPAWRAERRRVEVGA